MFGLKKCAIWNKKWDGEDFCLLVTHETNDHNYEAILKINKNEYEIWAVISKLQPSYDKSHFRELHVTNNDWVRIFIHIYISPVHPLSLLFIPPCPFYPFRSH